MVFETIEDHKTKPTPSHHFEIKPKIRIEYVFYYFGSDETDDKYDHKLDDCLVVFHLGYIK